MRDRRDVGDHVCGVASVAGHPPDFLPIFARAWAANTARAAKPAHARSRPRLPAVDALAQRVDDADHLMPRHARILDDRKEALHRPHIAVADAAGLDANADLLRTRDWNVPLFGPEPSATLPDDH